jgi:hypothetical protein
LDAIHRLAAAYRQDLGDDQLHVYWDGLSDLEPARLAAAVDVAIRTSQWLPKVAELRRFANELPAAKARKFVNGEEVYDCPLCEDSGTVAVWHPDTVRGIRNGKDVARAVCVVACVCSEGDRWARERTLNGKRWPPLPRFDDKRMRRPQFTFEKEGQTHLALTGRYGEREATDLLAWIEAQERIENHPNYTDFGDYSAEHQETF